MRTASLRTIHFVPAVSEEASGPSYSVVRLCESLIAEGEDVTLATLDWPPMHSPQAFLERFPLGLGPRRLGRSPAMRQWLTRIAAAGEVGLIHNHSLWMMPNVYPGLVARKFRIPLITSPRGTLSNWAFANGSPSKRLFWPFVQRPALNASRCFHATASSEHEDIRRRGFRQPVAIIPNGIDIPQWMPKRVTEHRTLLFMGRIHPKKGLDLLLPAWAVVQRRFPEWRLRLVGPGAEGYLRQMRQMAAELRLERIEFAGGLLGQAKWQAYRDADLFVLPTHSENFGLSVAEALAIGTPAIVTTGAPWAGLVEHGVGWWPEIGIDALVESLEDAFSRPRSELESMGMRGREWMQADFSWRRVGKMMGRTYRWLLQGGAPPEWVRLD